MSGDQRPTPLIYAGIFLVTLSTLMHEILLTRIFSVTMWYHFAFMAISIAMFGMTVGAIVVYLQKGGGEALETRLAKSALYYALTLVGGFFVYLKIPFIGDSSAKSIFFLALSYSVISVPFVYSGITVALILSTFQKDASKLYAADLLGAALGCIVLVFTLDFTDAPSAVLVVGFFAALSSACFARANADVQRVRNAASLALVLAGVAVYSTVATQGGKPFIKMVDTAQNSSDVYHYVRWNSHSRVTVSGNPWEPTGVAGWGISDKTGAGNVKIRQLGMSIDTWAGTVITEFDGDTQKLSYLKDDVTNIAHWVRPHSDVFVVGVGGGRDVLSALVFDQKSVTGVEVNRDVLRATTQAFGDFAGHIERNPKVTLAVDEARSYLTRQNRKFDIIQLSLIDTWAATAAGAFVLTENSLYTAEGWTTFLEHLTPRGVLSVSRWYYPTRPGEALRIAALAREALSRIGVSDPSRHVLMIKAPRAQGLPGALGNGICTILVFREPFTDQDLATLDAETSRMGFLYVARPGAVENPAYASILGTADPEPFYRSYSLDVSPPTDDRPFFFQMLRIGDVMKSMSQAFLDPNRSNLEAIRLLAALLVIVTVLTALCVVTPLALTTQKGTLSGAAPLLGFFFAIGLGFMFIEVSEMQRLMLLLGKPTYALSVVLFTLLVGSGTGSMVSSRIAGAGRPISTTGALVILVFVLVGVGGATPVVVRALVAASTPVRILSAATLLLPMGFVMGLPFPIGLGAAKSRPELVPWLWGVNGAASVLCSVLATVVALSLGISASFWAGVLCYAGALTAHALTRREAEAA
ncbi:MAG TPA: hypothetical protein VHE30_27935 [Polyangiaceae bacterium]|nr:hypothetical protein [Polyangiaceae bacterium]